MIAVNHGSILNAMISRQLYMDILNTSDLWHCLVCSINTNLDSMPFTVCNNLELTNINNSDFWSLSQMWIL